MPSRTLWFLGLFPALLAAQRSPAVGVDRQVISAALWAEARYNYAYWDAVRANWDSAFAATVTFTNAHPAPTDLQFVQRLDRWGALLNDGQLEILPPPAVANRVARPPLALRSIERRPFIMDYAVNDEMRVARPERLAEILAVQGVPVADWIRDSVLPGVSGSSDASRWERAVVHMLDGERGTALHLSLKPPGGAERGASVTRSIALTSRWPLAPPSLQADTLPDGVIWVRIGTLDDPQISDLLDRALGDAPREGLRHRGLILDLRETSEGTREQGYALLSRLTDHPLLAPRHRTPFYDLDSLRWLGSPPDTIWPPTRRERIPYTGPVVALSSSRTAGAAEELLMAFHAGGRGAIIGETSAGSVGQTAILSLAAGWKLRVTVSRAAYPDGREIERSGIVPDIPVEVRVQDVLAGRDAVLDRARAYLSETARR
jgi:C-terminal processing protease CtpA/Prc